MGQIETAKPVRDVATVTTRLVGASTVLAAVGEFDAATVSTFSAVIDRAVMDDLNSVVLDLSGVTFMGAAMMNAIVLSRGALRDRSRSLTVREPSPIARRVLQLCDCADWIELRCGASGRAAVGLVGVGTAAPTLASSTLVRPGDA